MIVSQDMIDSKIVRNVEYIYKNKRSVDNKAHLSQPDLGVLYQKILT